MDADSDSELWSAQAARTSRRRSTKVPIEPGGFAEKAAGFSERLVTTGPGTRRITQPSIIRVI